jgi:putative PEP-CTERM system histidine kinase
MVLIDASILWSYLLEPLRDLALLIFLVFVLHAHTVRSASEQRSLRQSIGVMSGLVVLLISMMLYRSASGEDSILMGIGGVDFIFAGFLVAAIAGLVLVEQFMRNVRKESRRAVKYLCIGLGAIFAYDFYLYSHALLFQGVNYTLWSARGFVNALVVPVIAVGVARDPEWSSEIYVSRRAVFHSAALLGSGLYLLAMGIGAYFVRIYGGTWGHFAQVVFLFGAGLVLLILLFSAQLRAHLRVFLNKHFFHYKYEYRDEWLRLIDALSSGEPDENFCERCIKAVADILASQSGLLWVYRDSGRYELVGQWRLAAPTGHKADLSSDHPLVRYLKKREWVVNIDEWRNDPDLYEGMTLPYWLDESAWLITPLMFHDRLLGVMLLTRPQVVPPLNWEDYDLLRTVSRQTAAHLAQLEAAQALAQAKQFEASSRMSAYVMHDLKNLIAQLSLVVSNAARHKHNPQFMEDAIVTVENSVNKMNRLLATLRSGGVADAKKSSIDLCETLSDVVDTMSAGQPRPSLDFQAVGLRVRADKDRFAAVVGHVIRNAQDATPSDGTVRVRLFKQSDRAIIEVQDNGCGMDEQFIRERLFKPFDSTKGDSGMGIGAHETRAFVQAMGGSIEVISRLGEGTTFRIALPISEDGENSVKFADNSEKEQKGDDDIKEIAGYRG